MYTCVLSFDVVCGSVWIRCVRVFVHVLVYLRVVHVFAYIYVCDLGDCENSCAIIYVYVVMCLCFV